MLLLHEALNVLQSQTIWQCLPSTTKWGWFTFDHPFLPFCLHDLLLCWIYRLTPPLPHVPPRNPLDCNRSAAAQAAQPQCLSVTLEEYKGIANSGSVYVMQVNCYTIYCILYIHVHVHFHLHMYSVFYIHYITLDYITFHSIALHYIRLHYIPLHCFTLHYITLHSITLHTCTIVHMKVDMNMCILLVQIINYVCSMHIMWIYR